MRSLQFGINEGMPVTYAEDWAVQALPFDPVFVKMIPSPPQWLTTWDTTAETSQKAISQYLQQCQRQIEKIDSNLILGSLSFPIGTGRYSRLGISCVCGMFDAESLTPQLFDTSCGYSTAHHLDKKIMYHTEIPEALPEGGRPLLARTMPLTRYGHWHSEVETRGVNVPILPSKESPVVGLYDNNQLILNYQGNVIAMWGYWNTGWEVAFPAAYGPNCGTYTLLKKISYNPG